jgi:hypothetical protein
LATSIWLADQQHHTSSKQKTELRIDKLFEKYFNGTAVKGDLAAMSKTKVGQPPKSSS